MKISIIACVNKKRALGKNGDLLYKIPNDLRNFKKITKNSIVIMGMNTWNSLPIKPLPERINIALSKTGVEYDQYGEVDLTKLFNMNPITFKSLEDALHFSNDLTGFSGNDEIFIIGGGSLYREVLEKGYADKLYITEVLDDAEGDIYFPDYEKDNKWKLWFETDPIAVSDSDLKYRYKFYKK